MELTNAISLVLFLLFIISYSAKLIIQVRRNKINAYVLGKGAKPKETRIVELFVRFSTFIWGTVWVLESLFEEPIGFIVGSFLDAEVVVYLGLFFMALGLMIFIRAMMGLKTSWRVGIDKETKSDLIVNGIYKYSRNPAFVGFDLMFIGLFFTYSNILILLVAIANILGLHLLILQEEQHLKSVYKEEYLRYMNRTPRYFGCL